MRILFAFLSGYLCGALSVWPCKSMTPPMTPPEQIRIGHLRSPSWEDMPSATPIHHTHSQTNIEGTIHNQSGQDLEVNIKVEDLRESDGDKNKQIQTTKRTLIISHGCTAIITAMIGAGATLAVKYGENCK